MAGPDGTGQRVSGGQKSAGQHFGCFLEVETLFLVYPLPLPKLA